MSRPLFILGLQRSGTTWLGNLLASHPDVAAATDAAHRGIHESVFFSHFARAWDWRDPDARRTALGAFAASDYGRLVGASAEMTDDPRPAAHFDATMERFADTRTVWVEKSPHHTRLGHAIARDLPAARFVCVTRASAGLIASRLHAYGRALPVGRARARAILRGAVSNGAHTTLMERFARDMGARARLLRYEDLARDPDAVLPGLLRWLGIDADVALRSRFAANSSFGAGIARPEFSFGERRLIAVGTATGRRVPARALARAIPRPVFPSWVWSDPTLGQGATLAAPRRTTP